MTLTFVCDSCGTIQEGSPRGYDGDLCIECYIKSEESHAKRCLDDSLEHYELLIAGAKTLYKKRMEEIQGLRR